jgi:endonuclease/exonuclease/phosphatase family metal-dependent hydrolase
VLHHKFDGTTESGNTIADWLTQRLPKAAALVNEADPDVMSIEEADDYVDNIKTTQVQSLQHWLLTHYGLTYGLADGDDVDGSPRTGNYVLYRTDKFAPVPGTTGRWTLSNNRWATYVELASLSTGARFYVVSVHLAQVKTSEAPDVNALRKIETQTLLADAANQAGTVPVLYAGDFNSYTGLGSQDTPGHVMLSAHVAEGMAVAQSRTVTQYGTVNDYRRVPPLHSTRWIDRFFTTPGIATRWWTQILHLTNGAFVGTIPSDHNPIVAGINVQY